MRILADLHHFGLFNSLHLLFENRLGYELYRPVGEDWLTNNYWRMAEIYNNHPATIAQYLGVNDTYEKCFDGVYSYYDPGHNYIQKAVTLDGFMHHVFDIVIATIPDHIESFARLAADHPNKPKLIYQVGNQWKIDPGSPIKNILSSARLGYKPPGFNVIEYHQEFNLDIFVPREKPFQNKIWSFVNCFGEASIFDFDWHQFMEVEKNMPEWSFKSFGAQCRDGLANGEAEVARLMQEADFVWHVKYGGDGYGHIIHNAAALGKPAIVRKSYYQEKMAGDLMVDGETCIAIDGMGIQEIKNKIEHFSNPDRYRRMCEATYANFKRLVDFDAEGDAIGHFIDNLL